MSRPVKRTADAAGSSTGRAEVGEDVLLERIKKFDWVEDYEVDEMTLDKIVAYLCLFTESAAIPRKIAIDGSERARIEKLVYQTRAYIKTLRDTTRHPGVRAYFIDAYARTNAGLRSESELFEALGHLTSLNELLEAGELALQELGATKRSKGAPKKTGRLHLIGELGTLIRDSLRRANEPLLPWDKAGAEVARILELLLKLVGIEVSRKTLQNLLGRPK